jgi:hypothetical protein
VRRVVPPHGRRDEVIRASESGECLFVGSRELVPEALVVDAAVAVPTGVRIVPQAVLAHGEHDVDAAWRSDDAQEERERRIVQFDRDCMRAHPSRLHRVGERASESCVRGAQHGEACSASALVLPAWEAPGGALATRLEGRGSNFRGSYLLSRQECAGVKGDTPLLLPHPPGGEPEGMTGLLRLGNGGAAT